MTILEKIEKLFEKPDKFSQENIHQLTRDVLEYMQSLQPTLHSKDENERDAAIKSAQLLQERLQKKATEVCKTLGIDPTNIGAHFAQPEKADMMKQTQSEIGMMNEALGSAQIRRLAKKKRPRHVKEWLAS